MELKQEYAPHIRLKDTPQMIMRERMLVLLTMLIPPLFMYGARTLVLAVMGVLGAVAPEFLVCLIKKEEQTISDFSAVCSGLVCALLMPAGVPVWMPAAAGAFGCAVAKLPFGRFGRSVFDSAAVGFTFVAVAWGNFASFLYYPRVGDSLPLFGTWTNVGEDDMIFDFLTPIQRLQDGKDPGLTVGEMLIGKMNGPLGCTMILLIIAAGVYLGVRKLSAWQASAAFAATVFVTALFFRYDNVHALMSPVYELLGGWMLFAGVFLVGNLNTAPKFASGRVIYGILCGVLAVIFRHIAACQGGEIFAVVILNAVSPAVDRFVWSCRERGISFNKLRNELRHSIDNKLKPFGDDE